MESILRVGRASLLTQAVRPARSDARPTAPGAQFPVVPGLASGWLRVETVPVNVELINTGSELLRLLCFFPVADVTAGTTEFKSF